MIKQIIIIASLFVGIGLNSIAQDEEKSNSLASQFTTILENSNDYQGYKVINKSELEKLQRNINDSIAVYENAILKSNQVISEQKRDIDSSHQEIDHLNIELKESQSKVENIDFFGIATQKSTFTTIMLSIIIALIIITLVMVFIFKRGQKNTKLAKEKLVETQQELDNHSTRFAT